MDNNIAYLVQTPDYIPDYVKILEDMGRDVYIHSWKRPVEHKNNIFFPDSTVWEGRNKLIEAVPKKYLYYVVLDDDLELFIREKKYSEDRGKNPWKVFDDFLIEYEPAVGTLAYRFHQKFTTYDTAVLAFHRDIIDLCFPTFLGFDDISWWWTAYVCLNITILFFDNHILYCDKIRYKNKRKAEYQRTNIYRYLDKICISSLLEKRDVSFLTSWNFSSSHKYKKPRSFKYRDMMENFKDKINKNHIFWRDHPFINSLEK